MSTAEPAYLSVAETARTLRLSEDTVYRRVADGSPPSLRLTDQGAIRVPRTAIESPPQLGDWKGPRPEPTAPAIEREIG